MHKSILIADSGPLIALTGVEHLDLLRSLYHRIIVPQAVVREITLSRHMSDADHFTPWPSWMERMETPSSLDAISIILGRGETEAITVARHHVDSILLLDDQQARRVAEALDLKMIGTAGILVRAKNHGIINTVRPILRSMRENGYYLSDRLIEKACNMAGE